MAELAVGADRREAGVRETGDGLIEGGGAAVDRERHRPVAPQQLPPDGEDPAEGGERRAVEGVGAVGAVLDAVGQVGDDHVGAAAAEDAGELSGIAAQQRQGLDLPRPLRGLVPGQLGVEAGAEHPAVDRQAGRCARVLEAVRAHPGGEEGAIGIMVGLVDVGADGAEPEAQRARERGPSPAHRVQQRQGPVEQAGAALARGAREVDQQRRELLVRLARVAQRGLEIARVAADVGQGDRLEQLAAGEVHGGEQRHRRGQRRGHAHHRLTGRPSAQLEVLDPGDVADARGDGDAQVGAQHALGLAEGERRGGGGVDAVGRGRPQHEQALLGQPLLGQILRGQILRGPVLHRQILRGQVLHRRVLRGLDVHHRSVLMQGWRAGYPARGVRGGRRGHGSRTTDAPAAGPGRR